MWNNVWGVDRYSFYVTLTIMSMIKNRSKKQSISLFCCRLREVYEEIISWIAQYYPTIQTIKTSK